MNDNELGGTRIVMTDKKSFENFNISQLSNIDDGTVDALTGRPVRQAQNQPAPQPVVQQQQIQQAPRTQINRRMVVVGYKGKAEAWIKTFDKLFKARGGQTDRHMYLAFDPREEEMRDAVIDAGTRTFEKFVLIPYRYNIPSHRIGLPAPKNLDALMGQVQEEHFNGGPALMAIPFHTLHGTPFDQIENHYRMSKTPFLGYEMVKTHQGAKVRLPGALLVFPPGWVTHPNYTLKKGLSAVGGSDLWLLRDEILRDMRTCEQICGSGQTPSSFACIQGFDTNEAFGPETVADPNKRPEGAKAVGVPLPPGALIVNDGLARTVKVPEPEKTLAVIFSKEDILDSIKSGGFASLSGPQKRAYSDYIVEDEAFFESANKATASFKVKEGKAKKKQMAAATK